MSKDFDYQKTKEQLDQILVWFEGSDVSVDEAIKKYQKAEELLGLLQEYLNDTKAKVEILTKKSAK